MNDEEDLELEQVCESECAEDVTEKRTAPLRPPQPYYGVVLGSRTYWLIQDDKRTMIHRACDVDRNLPVVVLYQDELESYAIGE